MSEATVGKEQIAFNGFSTAKAVLPLTSQVFAQFAQHLASNSKPSSTHVNFAEEFRRDIRKPYRLEQQRTNKLLIILHKYYGGIFTTEGLSMNCICSSTWT